MVGQEKVAASLIPKRGGLLNIWSEGSVVSGNSRVGEVVDHQHNGPFLLLLLFFYFVYLKYYFIQRIIIIIIIL